MCSLSISSAGIFLKKKEEVPWSDGSMLAVSVSLAQPKIRLQPKEVLGRAEMVAIPESEFVRDGCLKFINGSAINRYTNRNDECLN